MQAQLCLSSLWTVDRARTISCASRFSCTFCYLPCHNLGLLRLWRICVTDCEPALHAWGLVLDCNVEPGAVAATDVERQPSVGGKWCWNAEHAQLPICNIHSSQQTVACWSRTTSEHHFCGPRQQQSYTEGRWQQDSSMR